MEWEAALRQHLLADGAVAALAGDRVFLNLRAQGSGFPAVVLTAVADSHPQDLDGFQGNRPGRVQVDCWADGGALDAPETRAQVVALRKAVIAALAGPFTSEGRKFGRTSFMPGVGGSEAGETRWLHRERFDAMTWHD